MGVEMLNCRFCGNRIEVNSYVCNRCGRAITDINPYEKPDKYGKYDSSKDTSVTGRTMKRKPKHWKMNRFMQGIVDMLWKLIILFVLVVWPVYFGYVKIRDRWLIPYQETVKDAVTANIENNIEMRLNISAVRYQAMYLEYYGDIYWGVKYMFRQDREETIRQLEAEYGEDYTIEVTIDKVEDFSGTARRKMLDRAINAVNRELQEAGIDMNCRDYFPVNKIKKVKRVRATAAIVGSKKKKEQQYVVDIAKMEGKRAWKVLYVYPQ